MHQLALGHDSRIKVGCYYTIAGNIDILLHMRVLSTIISEWSCIAPDKVMELMLAAEKDEQRAAKVQLQGSL